MSAKQVPWWNYSVVYWLDDQVALTFHSKVSLARFRRMDVISSLRLTDLNDFLNIRGLQLQAFEPQHTYRRPVRKGQQDSAQRENNDQMNAEDGSQEEYNGNEAKKEFINADIGKYMFPAASGQGTTVVSYFTVAATKTAHHWQDAMMADIKSNDSKTKQVVNSDQPQPGKVTPGCRHSSARGCSQLGRGCELFYAWLPYLSTVPRTRKRFMCL